MDYQEKVKAIQREIRRGKDFYINTFIGRLRVDSLDDTWARAGGRSWMICSREINQWFKKIQGTKKGG